MINNIPTTKPNQCSKCGTPEGRGLASCPNGGYHVYDPKPIRPPKGAALSTIRAWDRAYTAWRDRNPSVCTSYHGSTADQQDCAMRGNRHP